MTRSQQSLTERQAWIALASTPGVGDLTFSRLLDRHGDARSAMAWVAGTPWGRADRRLAADLGMRLRRGLAAAIRESAADPERASRDMRRLGGWILTPLDGDYPDRLHGIEEPPPVIYGLGDAAALARARMVAVVGTRRPTAAGRDLAARVSQRLVEARATVVSGLAVGIDGAAHQAALQGGGETVAVVGGGLDAPGPTAHRGLARRIAAHGAVIAEVPPRALPTRGTFPRRNRIISALATATVVVEAPARSGALITARHALEQGRRLLVATGRPMDPRVAGNLVLLRETPAMPLIGLDEMVADLRLARGEGSEPPTSNSPRLELDAALELLAVPQRAVARVLATGPQSTDGICRATGLEPGVVAASLTVLQLRGWARLLGATHLPAGPLLVMDKDADT